MSASPSPELTSQQSGEFPQILDARLQIMAQLAVHTTVADQEISWYRAADPGYQGNFTRDSLTSSMLMGNVDMLRHQLLYSAHYQGVKYDVRTGEEPGKIHHELLLGEDGRVDGMEMNGSNSAYNACDTTAQFLQGIAMLAELEGPEVLSRYSGNIEAAISYIKNHVRDNIFYEMPMHGETGKRFALKVTYWKDSRLNHPNKEEPEYPISYSLAHFQNADALRTIGQKLNWTDLVQLGDNMTRAGIEKFWHDDHFVVAIDGKQAEILDSLSSDSLHSLLYIPPYLLPQGYAQKIEQYMTALSTDAGYRTGFPSQTENDYHTDYVWTHEQALLHAAAELHGLDEARIVSRRVTNYYGEHNPELIHAHTLEHDGNLLQLWAVAAAHYLERPETSFYHSLAQNRNTESEAA